jgi:uncharacterized protein with PIN domain
MKEKEFINYNSIKGNYSDSWEIPYEILLNTIQWRDFREKILTRDFNRCKKCNTEGTTSYWSIFSKKVIHHRDATIEELKKWEQEHPTTYIDLLGDGTPFPLRNDDLKLSGITLENPIYLHAHHKYYIYLNLPWEYNTDALETLCNTCHNELHQNEIIKVYSDINKTEEIEVEVCDRCYGTGFLDEFHYYHNGICFKCEGKKYIVK